MQTCDNFLSADPTCKKEFNEHVVIEQIQTRTLCSRTQLCHSVAIAFDETASDCDFCTSLEKPGLRARACACARMCVPRLGVCVHVNVLCVFLVWFRRGGAGLDVHLARPQITSFHPPNPPQSPQQHNDGSALICCCKGVGLDFALTSRRAGGWRLAGRPTFLCGLAAHYPRHEQVYGSECQHDSLLDLRFWCPVIHRQLLSNEQRATAPHSAAWAP